MILSLREILDSFKLICMLKIRKKKRQKKEKKKGGRKKEIEKRKYTRHFVYYHEVSREISASVLCATA